MELLGIMLVAGVILWVLSAKKTEAHNRVRDLENWSYTDTEVGFVHTSYEVHFPTMTLREHGYSVEEPGIDERRESSLRRDSSGGWSRLMSTESYLAELEFMRRTFDDPDKIGATMSPRYERLKAGNEWEPVATRIGAMIETAYQRYIHHRT